jgi:hypothetical protein
MDKESNINDRLLSTETVRVHNASVRSEVIKKIKSLLTASYERLCKENDPTHTYIEKHHILYKIAKEICGYGWTDVPISDVFLDALISLEQSNNWWLHETYNALVDKGFASKINPYFVGYDTIKE